MQIKLTGFEGSALFESSLPSLFSKRGSVKVAAKQGAIDGYKAVKAKSGYEIEYGSASDLSLALGDIIAGDAKADGSLVAPSFKFRGVMHDSSRNGVPSVPFLKVALAKFALIGINKFCLYTEDTYEVDGEPLIGYGRGAYTQAELGELSEFGDKLGIELFPCIQTLGHLQEILKHDKFRRVWDNNSVINVLKDESYEFVKSLVASAVKPYKSKLIHIGTDEPWGIGRGHSLDFEHPKKPGELYATHVARMDGICKDLGLQPIIWGDYILGHTGEAALDKSQDAVIPRSVILDNWNYYSLDPVRYEKDLDTYRNSGYKLMVSPGVWNWNRFFPVSEYAMKTTETFMRAAHGKGVGMALTTMWGDDGQECFFDSNWPALCQFAAWCRKPEPEASIWQSRTEKVCGIPASRVQLFTALQKPCLDDKVSGPSFPLSKALLYDDPLFGYAAMSVEGFDTDKELIKLSKAAASAKAVSPIDAGQLKLAALFTKISGSKLSLFRAAKKAYKASDRKALGTLPREALRIASDIRRFKALFAKIWLEERKPFGLEVIELRLAGVESRLKTFASRVSAYAKGGIDSIPELELEQPSDIKPGFFWTYSRAASMCPLSHNRSLL